jgi:hypothetical protein
MPQFKSPNGELIVSVLEKTPCAVSVGNISADGKQYEPDGNGSTMWWDDQYPVMKGDSFIFIDEDGDQWTFNQLTLYVEEDEGEDEERDLDIKGFDSVQEAFQANPNAQTAGAYLEALMEYEADDMIGDDTFLNGLSSVRDFLKQQEQVSG